MAADILAVASRVVAVGLAAAICAGCGEGDDVDQQTATSDSALLQCETTQGFLFGTALKSCDDAA